MWIDRSNTARADLKIRFYTPHRFCEMRFLQSELCVYLNLLKDYPIYIEYNKKMSTIPVVDDLAAATGGNRRPGRKQRKKLNSDELTALSHLNRLLDFAFVCNVLTIVDMLGHMRKFSLFAQMSNSLPLEVLEGTHWNTTSRCSRSNSL